MKTIETLTEESRLWTKFALLRGARFDVQKKTADALAFSANYNGHLFAIPSKLEGTSRFQENICYMLARLDDATRHLDAEVMPGGRVAVGFGMYTLGFVQKKHECWVRPLVEAGPCLFDLLQVTGGTPDKPTRGVNIAICNLAEAIQMCAARMTPGDFTRLAA